MSSKRRLRRRSCSNKIRYNDSAEAEKAIFEMSQKGKIDGLVNHYRCKFCGGRHIGHPPRAIQEMVR